MSRDDHPELLVDPDIGLSPPDRSRPIHRQTGLLMAVALGGLLGSFARYALAVEFPAPAGGWPAGTFLANVMGALLLGVLLEALARSGSDEGWRRRARLLAGTGFYGAFTTYSSLAVEANLMLRAGEHALALAYAAASVAAGLAATFTGVVLAARLCSHQQEEGDA